MIFQTTLTEENACAFCDKKTKRIPNHIVSWMTSAACALLEGLLLPELARVVNGYLTLLPSRGDVIANRIVFDADMLPKYNSCRGRVVASPVRDELWFLGWLVNMSERTPSLVRTKTDGRVVSTHFLQGCYNAITSTSDGYLVLLDTESNVVTILSVDGDPVAHWKLPDVMFLSYLFGLATMWDPDVGGHVLFVLTTTRSIRVFDLFRGTLLREWNTPFTPRALIASQQWIIIQSCERDSEIIVYDRFGRLVRRQSKTRILCGAAAPAEQPQQPGSSALVFLSGWPRAPRADWLFGHDDLFSFKHCDATGIQQEDFILALLTCFHQVHEMVILSDGRIAVFDVCPRDSKNRMTIMK